MPVVYACCALVAPAMLHALARLPAHMDARTHPHAHTRARERTRQAYAIVATEGRERSHKRRSSAMIASDGRTRPSGWHLTTGG